MPVESEGVAVETETAFRRAVGTVVLSDAGDIVKSGRSAAVVASLATDGLVSSLLPVDWREGTGEVEGVD